MSLGYSAALVKLNKTADARKSLGVKLGRACINNNVPVASVARVLHVSRQTVYNWFVNYREPQRRYEEKIKELISKINN